jgi:hypothetical protein
MSKQVTVPSFDQVADKSALAKSHVPDGATSVVNGRTESLREVPVAQTVNGVTVPAGTVEVPTNRR